MRVLDSKLHARTILYNYKLIADSWRTFGHPLTCVSLLLLQDSKPGSNTLTWIVPYFCTMPARPSGIDLWLHYTKSQSRSPSICCHFPGPLNCLLNMTMRGHDLLLLMWTPRSRSVSWGDMTWPFGVQYSSTPHSLSRIAILWYPRTHSVYNYNLELLIMELHVVHSWPSHEYVEVFLCL